MSKWEVINGDCQDVLKGFDDNSVECVLCDPPYGLSKEPDIVEVLEHWLAGDDYEHRSKGFMGKTWDSFVPGPSIWKECYRVLKPGGFILVFSSTRTYDLMGISLRLAGFKIHPFFAHIFGSGFPKGRDVGKSIDQKAGVERKVVGQKIRGSVEKAKECGVGYLDDPANKNNKKQFGYGVENITAPATEEAKKWEGWKYGLQAIKPAMEPILVAQKNFDGKPLDSILEHEVGAFNIDACRVNVNPEDVNIRDYTNHKRKTGSIWGNAEGAPKNLGEKGRYPANVLLVHGPECPQKDNPEQTEKEPYVYDGNEYDVEGFVKTCKPKDPSNYGDEKQENPVECQDGCPVKALGEQSGESVSSGGQADNQFRANNDIYGKGRDAKEKRDPGLGDRGTASRFFNQFHPDCQEGCPVKALGEQSGNITSKGNRKGKIVKNNKKEALFNKSVDGVSTTDYGDEGTASRFFNQFNPEDEPPFFYCSKASGKEREQGLKGNLPCSKCGELDTDKHEGGKCRRNNHPTVKPLSLLKWLLKLVTREGQTILDPFCGSGSTGCAAVQENRDFIGIELEEHSAEIARARIQYWENYEPPKPKKKRKKATKKKSKKKKKVVKEKTTEKSIFDIFEDE